MEATAIRKMIDQLRRELVEIQFAIHALETLAAGKRRRGRPPKFAQPKPAAGRKKPKPKPPADS